MSTIYKATGVGRDREVPPVLYSGHHANVDKWQKEHSLINTYNKRPDLLEKKELSKEDKELLENYINSLK